MNEIPTESRRDDRGKRLTREQLFDGAKRGCRSIFIQRFFWCFFWGFVLIMGVTGCAQPKREAIVIRPGPVGSRAGSVSGNGVSLDVLTYNVWGLPSWLRAGPHNRYDRIAEHLDELDVDLILLQEMWTKEAQRALPAGGPWTVAATRHSGCLFRRNGLAVLSVYPVISGEFRAFSTSAFPDLLVNKGVLKVTLEVSGGRRVNVWNVHLQSRGAERTRSRQIAELIGWVESADDGQELDLIAGDFNCTPGSRQHRELCAAFGPSVRPALQVPHFPTYDGFSNDPGRARTLDYVFVRSRDSGHALQAKSEPAFTAESAKGRWSDHVAVRARLDLSWASDFLAPPTPEGVAEDHPFALFVRPASP